MQSAVLEEKRNGLRRTMSKRRSTLPPVTCLSWSWSIQAKVLELPRYRAAPSIALYCEIGNEVKTGAILHHALAQKKKVFCPKTSGDYSPRFVQIFSSTDLVSESGRPAEPKGDVVLTAEDCEDAMVIVPAVVFDVHGNRLGRGGGWYDRALTWFEDRAVFVGLAYEFQVVERVPMKPWDKKVHYVITEARVIDCGVMPHEEIAR